MTRHRNPMPLAARHQCLMPRIHDSRASGSSSIEASRPSAGSRRSNGWPKRGLRVSNPNSRGHATKRGLRVPNPNSRGPATKRGLRVPNPNSRGHTTERGLRVPNPNSRGHATKRGLRVPNPNSRGHATKRGLRVPIPNARGHATKRGLRVPNPNSRGHATKRGKEKQERKKERTTAFAPESIWRCTWAGVLLRMQELHFTTNDICIAARLAHLRWKAPRNKRHLYSTSSCDIWRSKALTA